MGRKCTYRTRADPFHVRQSHETGDAESSHGHFEAAMDRALQLRSSRDFASRDDYQTFLRQVLDKRTRPAASGAEEVALLRPLPAARLESRLCLAMAVAIVRLVHRNREARQASMASGRHSDALSARQKERVSRPAALLAFAFRARTIWIGSAAAWQSFGVA